MKKGKRAGRKVKDLPAKNLSTKQAKRIRGGIIVNWAPNPADATNNRLLLPAVQKVRE